jgi:hypothetical protein
VGTEAVGFAGRPGVDVAGFDDGVVRVGADGSGTGSDAEGNVATGAPIGPMCAPVPL